MTKVIWRADCCRWELIWRGIHHPKLFRTCAEAWKKARECDWFEMLEA